MISNLYVKNLALIDQINIDFEQGLTILTGETGAGKSIILGSIAIALGLKTSSDMIRKGQDNAISQISFYFKDKEILEKLSSMGIEDLEDGEIIIQRKITANRSQFKINGLPTNATLIKSIAPFLLDLHGQRDNLVLLKEDNQLALVDSFCGETFKKAMDDLKDLYEAYKKCQEKLASLDLDDNQRQREIDLLAFEIDEIQKAKLKVGEDIDLEEKFALGENASKIKEGLSKTLEHLSFGDTSADEELSLAIRYFSDIISLDKRLSTLYDMINDAQAIVEEVSRGISSYVEESDIDEENFAYISERLDLYNRLKDRYLTDVAGILKLCNEKSNKLDELENADKSLQVLKEEKNSLEKKMTALSQIISDERKKSANILSEQIKKAVIDLNFNDVEFKIDINKTKDFGSNGADIASFMISTNPGEEMKALKDVASGGELSRIMLAIKTIVAKHDNVESLIFDEIDTGISGRTAQKVAQKMALLSRDRQIICITHLPQIAAMADNHFLINKEVVDNTSKTDIKFLSEEESVKELSRLLGGSEITEVVLENASEMKKLANDFKEKRK